MSNDPIRYNQFGWDYELLNPLGDLELSWYRRFAVEVGGSILELACGTGRLLVKLAEAGCHIDGIDISETMLKYAGKRIESLAPTTRAHIRLLNRDMADLKLDQKYCLIIIADNSFGELETQNSQRSCLRSMVANLCSNGKILITVRRFELSKFKNGRMTFPWSNAMRHPATGKSVQRMLEVRLTDDSTMQNGVYTYKTTDENNDDTY